jgi:hypothetical protein
MDSKLKLFIYRKSELIRQNKTQARHFLSNQIGGSKKLKITYNDSEYIFDEAMDKDYYVLYSKDEFECVAVIIDIENKIAEIHGIGNYTSCLDDINTNVGSTLLKITLKMVKKYKDKLDVKKILITDNSLKKCHNKNIKLSVMLTLLTGDTWYGKYGFKPEEELLKIKYENNKKIMNTVTLKDIDLIKYLKMTILDKSVIEKSKKFIEKHQSQLVKDYLTEFLKQYDKTCEYFYDFYYHLFDDLGLYNLHRQTFELDI